MRIGSQVFTLAQLDDEGMALEAYSFGTSHARFWITYFDRGFNNPQVTMPRRCDDLEDDLLLLQIATPLWIWDKNEMIPFGFYER